MKPKIEMRALSVLMALLFVSVVMVPVVSAYEYPQQSWTQKNSNYYGGTNAYTASTIGYFGAVYIPGRDVYEYSYRITGVGETRDGNSNSISACRLQSLDIKETDNKIHQAIWTSTDPKYVGSWPLNDGNSAYYYDITYKISSMAISAVSSYAGFAISAADLVCSMLSGYDDHQDGETVWRTWEYYPDKTDVGHFFWWLIDIDPSQTIKFSVEDCLFGPRYEVVGVGWTFTVTAPVAPSKMTESEKEKYAIELIPINELKGRSEELNLAPETVDELTMYGEPIYYAHKIPIEAIPYEPDKEKVISKILERGRYSRDTLFTAVTSMANSKEK